MQLTDQHGGRCNISNESGHTVRMLLQLLGGDLSNLHVHVCMYADDKLECTGGAREYTMDEDDAEDIDYYEF